MGILIPAAIIGVIGAVFGVGLAFAAKKFSVHVDPRLEKIAGLLPGANCGACGGAGCFGFAEMVLSGKAAPDACRGASDEVKAQIAAISGQSVNKKTRLVATLHCNGGRRVADKFFYDGQKDCAAANSILGGPKTCQYGCIGLGSCVDACPFGAMSMSAGELPVIDADKCKACNKCVLVCPKKLFSLNAVNQPVFIGCASRDPGKDTKAACPVGCIACRLCEKACTFDAVHVIDNLAVIDYAKCTSCGACVKACPMKVIYLREKS